MRKETRRPLYFSDNETRYSDTVHLSWTEFPNHKPEHGLFPTGPSSRVSLHVTMSCGGMKVMITSRWQLEIDHETVLRDAELPVKPRLPELETLALLKRKGAVQRVWFPFLKCGPRTYSRSPPLMFHVCIMLASQPPADHHASEMKRSP
jgi:hypothetical protein